MVLTILAYTAVTSLIRLYQAIVYTLVSMFVNFARKELANFYAQANIRIVQSNKDLRGSDIVIHDDRYYPAVAAYKSLGVADSYMNGYWDCEDLEEHFVRVMSSKGYLTYLKPHERFMKYCQFQLFNLQTERRSWQVGKKHYDLGNDLFVAMLDKTLNYSCGYWKNAQNLEQAQINKMELIAKKLQLKPGMKVLDIGCGWGSLAKYLAENYQVSVVGLTISLEQAKLAQDYCKGFDVDIRLQDYRDLAETFDRVVSVEMFEQVGKSNYRTFFTLVAKSLTADGIFVLQTSGVSHPHIPLTTSFFHTYLFPNAVLPYHTSITREIDGIFVLEDWQNLSLHYSKTLRAWLQNFKRHWPKLKQNFPDHQRFYKMWTLYLSLYSAVFKSRRTQIWQIVLSKDGLVEGYDAPR